LSKEESTKEKLKAAASRPEHLPAALREPKLAPRQRQASRSDSGSRLTLRRFDVPGGRAAKAINADIQKAT
jgi:hypothetical protein